MNNNLIDLNDSSNSSSNAIIQDYNMLNTKSEKKKMQRDPFAHRRVEKTRRDRMNMSLNKLASLIPESFRRQSATTRIDKIKTLDIAIAYVEHLQSLTNQVKINDEKVSITKQDMITEPIINNSTFKIQSLPIKMSTATNTNNDNLFNENLWYMKGVYNGSVELISYLIEYTQLGLENTNQMFENVELLLELFRQYHRIYFNTHKINEKDVEFLTSSHKSRKFPLSNKKLIQKIKIALANNNIQLPSSFFLSICNLLQKNYRRSSSASSSSSSSGISSLETKELNGNHDELSNESEKHLRNNIYMLDNNSNSPNSLNKFQIQTVNNLDQNESRLNRFTKMNSNNVNYNQVNRLNDQKGMAKRGEFCSKQTMDTDEINKAKKLKTNLIQRFNHMSHHSVFNSNNQMNNINNMNNNINYRADDIIQINPTFSKSRNENEQMLQSQYAFYDFNVDRNYMTLNNYNSNNNNSISDVEQTILFKDNINYKQVTNQLDNFSINNENTISSNDVFSIFILHDSQEFYISACIDESLIDPNLVRSVLKNKDFRPNALHKVKIDALFSSNIMIGNNRKFLKTK